MTKFYLPNGMTNGLEVEWLHEFTLQRRFINALNESSKAPASKSLHDNRFVGTLNIRLIHDEELTCKCHTYLAATDCTMAMILNQTTYALRFDESTETPTIAESVEFNVSLTALYRFMQNFPAKEVHKVLISVVKYVNGSYEIYASCNTDCIELALLDFVYPNIAKTVPDHISEVTAYFSDATLEKVLKINNFLKGKTNAKGAVSVMIRHNGDRSNVVSLNDGDCVLVIMPVRLVKSDDEALNNEFRYQQSWVKHMCEAKSQRITDRMDMRKAG